MTDAASIDSDLNKQDELSREEILKQIFGDIGELIDGDNDVTVYLYLFNIMIWWYVCFLLFVYIYNNIILHMVDLKKYVYLYVWYGINIMYT